MTTPVPFYREVLGALTRADVPFLVGGAYALCRYIGVHRATKDLDLMVCEEDWPAVAQALRARGIVIKLVFPHWLGKAMALRAQVDIIFNGGNHQTPVTRDWFVHAVPEPVLGFQTLLCPVEELLWSKSFVMERERFDGADVQHLLRAFADRLDWRRLLDRFAGHEGLLRAHLMLFDYIYPGESRRIPGWVVPAVEAAIAAAPPAPANLCRGTRLSRAQYLVDIEEWGYVDDRLPPHGSMSDRDWLRWTNAIDTKQSRVRPGRRTSVPKPAAAAAAVSPDSSDPADRSAAAADDRKSPASCASQ
jgi:hypothetical protein